MFVRLTLLEMDTTVKVMFQLDTLYLITHQEKLVNTDRLRNCKICNLREIL